MIIRRPFFFFFFNDTATTWIYTSSHTLSLHDALPIWIYSMDGDFGNLKELIAVAESHGASVFIDEAHSMLACGEHGRGAAEKFGVEDRVPLVYGTFSKAFGALGGFVAGSKETLQYLRFYAHPYVYSCALPPVVIAAILKALELGTSQPELRAKLWENAEYFHAQLDKLGFDTGASTTYVMPIVIGDRELMYRLGHELRRRGLWVAPVDYQLFRKIGSVSARVSQPNTPARIWMRR